MDKRITVRMSAEMISRIDAWIAVQPGYVSRQDAVRRFVELSLERADEFSALDIVRSRSGHPDDHSR